MVPPAPAHEVAADRAPRRDRLRGPATGTQRGPDAVRRHTGPSAARATWRQYQGALARIHVAEPVSALSRQTCHSALGWTPARFNHDVASAHGRAPRRRVHRLPRKRPLRRHASRMASPATSSTTTARRRTTSRRSSLRSAYVLPQRTSLQAFDVRSRRARFRAHHRDARGRLLDCHGDGVYAGKPTACIACPVTNYDGRCAESRVAVGAEAERVPDVPRHGSTGPARRSTTTARGSRSTSGTAPRHVVRPPDVPRTRTTTPLHLPSCHPHDNKTDTDNKHSGRQNYTYERLGLLPLPSEGTSKPMRHIRTLTCRAGDAGARHRNRARGARGHAEGHLRPRGQRVRRGGRPEGICVGDTLQVWRDGAFVARVRAACRKVIAAARRATRWDRAAATHRRRDTTRASRKSPRARRQRCTAVVARGFRARSAQLPPASANAKSVNRSRLRGPRGRALAVGEHVRRREVPAAPRSTCADGTASRTATWTSRSTCATAARRETIPAARRRPTSRRAVPRRDDARATRTGSSRSAARARRCSRASTCSTAACSSSARRAIRSASSAARSPIPRSYSVSGKGAPVRRLRRVAPGAAVAAALVVRDGRGVVAGERSAEPRLRLRAVVVVHEALQRVGDAGSGLQPRLEARSTSPRCRRRARSARCACP